MANWYYYNSNGQKVGPIRGQALSVLAQNGTVTPDTLIENEGGKQAKAGKIQGLIFPQSAEAPIVQPPPLPVPVSVPPPPPQNKSESNGTLSPVAVHISVPRKKPRHPVYSVLLTLFGVAIILLVGVVIWTKTNLFGAKPQSTAANPVVTPASEEIAEQIETPGKNVPPIAETPTAESVSDNKASATAIKTIKNTDNDKNTNAKKTNEKVVHPDVFAPNEYWGDFVEKNVSPYTKWMVERSQKSSRRKLTDKEEQTVQNIVKLIIGEESNHYQEFGYKNLKLGKPDKLAKQFIASRRKDGKPHYYLESSVQCSDDVDVNVNESSWWRGKSKEYMVFDIGGNVVAVGKQYNGKFEEFQDSLIETFGKTNQKIENNIIKYTFPKVCVRVNVGSVGFTIHVIDRKYAENELAETLREAIRILEWSSLAVAHCNGFTKDNYRTILPPLDSAELRFGKDQGYDSLVCYEYLSKLPVLEELKMCPIAGVGTNWEHNNIVIVNFLAIPSFSKLGLVGQQLGYNTLWDAHHWNRPLSCISGWGDIEKQAIGELILDVYPPPEGKYKIIRKNGEWYQWKSEDRSVTFCTSGIEFMKLKIVVLPIKGL